MCVQIPTFPGKCGKSEATQQPKICWMIPGQLSRFSPPPAQPRICYHNDLLKNAVLYFGVNVTISREDIEKVAVLARIRLDEEQIPALENDLGNILSLVDQLSAADRSEEHTSELQSRPHLVCRLLLEKK